MSGKNASKKLLQCAIEAGSTSSVSSSNNYQSSDSDRRWLENAVTNISNAHVNLVERLKECIQVIKRFSDDSEIKADDVVTVMQEISDLCEDVDLACDLEKIGGFSPIIKCMQFSNAQIQSAAADVLATVSQNNEYCQNILLNKHNILTILLPMTIKSSETENQVSVKAVYAISCIIRQNKLGFKNYLEVGGFSYLLKGVQSSVVKVNLKSTFLLRNLCKDDHETHLMIDNTDWIDSLLKNLTMITQCDVVEFTLDILISSSCHLASFRESCSKKSTAFGSALSDIIGNKIINEDRPEIIKRCEQLFKILHLKPC